MESFLVIVAITGWVVALVILIIAIRIARRRLHAEAVQMQLRYVAREFLRSAREIEDLVYSGQSARSPQMAKAAGLMRMAFFDLSIDADASLLEAADRYRRHVLRLLDEYAQGGEENSGDRAERSACEENYVRSIEMYLRRDELESWPDWLPNPMSRSYDS